MVPSGKYAVGTVHSTNRCGKVKVIEYVSCKKITVEFLNTKNRVVSCSSNISIGFIKDNHARLKFGIGYLGDIPKGGTKNCSEDAKAYVAWSGMLRRCYSGKRRSYWGCSVVEEWHCFAHFLKWFNQTYPHNSLEKMTLDKDIRVPGNKVYGPNTCTWVTAAENNREMLERVYGKVAK